MYKKPKEFGTNFRNGIYYELTQSEGVIRGVARAVDLNQLAAPPDDLSVPPFQEYDIEPIELNNRAYPRLEIR